MSELLRRLSGQLRGAARATARRGGSPVNFHYIAIDGPIGVGKSSVVERLAERLDATTVLEEWARTRS